jgi:integrase
MVQRAIHIVGEYRLGQHRGQYIARGPDGFRNRIGLSAETDTTQAIHAFTNWVHDKTVSAARTNYTVGELFALYVDDRGRAGKQVQKFRDQWISLSKMFDGIKPHVLAEPRVVEGQSLTICHQYAYDRRVLGRARATIHSELSTLRSCIKWAFDHEYIEKRPIVWVPKKPKPRDTHLSSEEVMRLLESAISHHVRILLMIALYTGARKSAIEELTWDRVDLINGTIQFEIELSDDDAMDILDSSHKKGRAYVAIHPNLHAVLSFAKSVAQTSHAIEYRGRGGIDTRTGIYDAVKRASLGGRYIGVHALRHTLATMAADAGADMRVIQKTLGHDDIETTRKIYAKHSAGYTLPAAQAVADRMNF